MDKAEKRTLAERIDKWQAVKHLMNDQGFSIFLADFTAKREKHYRTLIQNNEHSFMLRSAGRVEVLDEVLSWMDKTVSEGEDAVQRLKRSVSDISEESE